MLGTWQRIEIAGKPADIYELSRGARPRFGILYLHPVGLETLIGNETFSRLFDQFGLVCVCPNSGRSWWVDRICPEFDSHITSERYILDHVVPFFQSRWNLTPPGIGLLGISMGGQGALRLGFRHCSTFPIVAGIASAIEFHNRYGTGTPLDEMYDSKEQARQDTAILHIIPHAYPPHIWFAIDPQDTEWFRGNDRLHEKLAALGIEHQCDLSTRAGGHSWDYFNSMAEPGLRFVVEALEQMSRRLL